MFHSFSASFREAFNKDGRERAQYVGGFPHIVYHCNYSAVVGMYGDCSHSTLIILK